MTNILAAVLVLIVTVAPVDAQEAVFKKDVKQYVTAGDRTRDHNVTLSLGADALTISRSGQSTSVPYAAITSATYDRRERQRKFLGLPAGGAHHYVPKRQHFLTIQFKVGDKGDFLELELGKDIAARVVATLEAKSGKQVDKIGG